MWSRRAFLQHASVALACLPALEVQAKAVRRGPLGKPIGIQLFTVAADAARDLRGTLKTLADIGYREVEMPGGPALMPPAELRKLLDDLGLQCPSIHTFVAELKTGLDERFELAHTLGARYVVCAAPWTADNRFQKDFREMAAGITLDDWKWNAEQLNRAGELAQRAGLRMGYHNHNLEFRSYDGTVAYDELLRLTDPALVTFELDIAWIVTAGFDPLRYLREHGARIELLHVKEVRKGAQVLLTDIKPQTTELGRGRIDWPTVFGAMDPRHIKHYFVEQENFDGAPLDAVKVDFDYLHRLGGKR